MRARSLAVVVTVLSLLVVAGRSRVARADAKSDIAAKLKAAMEAYDTFDYDGARKQLTAAIAAGEKAHLDKDPILAKAYLDLGIVAFAVPDKDAAKKAFVSAASIDPKIQIDVAYKSPELASLLDRARLEAKSSGGGGGNTGGGGDELNLGPETGGGGGADCSSVKGLEHQLIDSAKGGAPIKIEAQVGNDVKAAKVSVMFRSEGASDFTEVKLSKAGCNYTGQIPSAAVKGMVHYYVAAYDGGGKVIASKGSAGAPNIIEVTGGGGGGGTKGDEEDPLGGKKTTVASTTDSSGDDTSISTGANVPSKPKKIWIGVNGGTGGGYVTGTTEGGNTVKNCCLGENPVVLIGELGYNVNPQLAIGVAFRMGLPLGANLDGHSTGAPGGLIRVHYALSDDGDGLHVLGELGFGFLRNTIKLDDPMMGMDTDVVAQGPLLVGGGVGYGKKLGDMVRFTADLGAIVGLAVVSEVGAAPMNNGVSVDASVGFEFGLF